MSNPEFQLDSTIPPAEYLNSTPNGKISFADLHRPDLPIDTITLNTRHDPTEVHLCPLCEKPSEKTYTSHECWGKHKIVKAEKVAAYRCGPCDIQIIKVDAIVEFLTEAIDRIAYTRDSATLRLLRGELKSAENAQKVLKVSNNN